MYYIKLQRNLEFTLQYFYNNYYYFVLLRKCVYYFSQYAYECWRKVFHTNIFFCKKGIQYQSLKLYGSCVIICGRNLFEYLNYKNVLILFNN